MDPYLLLLCTGFGGLLLMALSGLGHHHHGHGHGHSHHGAGRGPHVHGVNPTARLLTLLSPRVLSSLLLGLGAAGLALRPLLVGRPAWVLPVLAAGGAWAFERLVVQPVWRTLFNFASQPARTLESLVLEEGQAVTNFDAAGDGLISVELDGQSRQLLGTLCAEDRAAGRRVRAGDRLFVRAVDERRNRCSVSKVGSGKAEAGS